MTGKAANEDSYFGPDLLFWNLMESHMNRL